MLLKLAGVLQKTCVEYYLESARHWVKTARRVKKNHGTEYGFTPMGPFVWAIQAAQEDIKLAEQYLKLIEKEIKQ
jgi:hypothetical protein